MLELLKSYDMSLFEDRLKSKELQYTETSKKVVAQFQEINKTGKKSKQITQLLSEYVDMDEKIKELKVSHASLNERIKEFAGDIFDVTDEYMTRVIEVSTFTMSLSKRGQSVKTDYEAALNELLVLNPKLKKLADTLISKHSEIKTTEARLTANRVKESEEITEGVFDKIKEWISSFKKWVSEIRNSFKSVDKDISKLKKLI